MKTYTKLFMFTLLLGLISCTRYKLLPVPPKAADLSDHFGTEPAANDYGPKVQVSPLLARQGVTGPGTPITPITNFYQEINPNEVVAGNLTNTAHDAGRIITPEMAVPKLDINSEITHEAIVQTPVKLGTQIEEKTVHVMNRVTGQIDSKTVLSEKPILGMMKNLREVKTNHNVLIDARNGNVIPKVPQTVLQ